MNHNILVIDGNKETGVKIKTALQERGVSVTISNSAKDAISRLSRRKYDLVFCSMELPEMPGLDLIEVEKQKHGGTDFVLLSESNDIERVVDAIGKGASNYLPKPVDLTALKKVASTILERRSLKDEVQYLKGRLHERYGIDSIIACSSAMEEVFKKIRAVAKTDSTVLIQGETGVGKELVANVIHLQSPRANGRFLAINCGAFPDTLLESELFGYEKGAFTGADSKRTGKFEAASGGTLFLDEIASISQAMQVRLLRVLQEKKVTRLGGNDSFPVDVRVICATNMEIKSLVAEGSFREDLYYRVNVFPIVIPPLRERKEDIPLLAAYFLKKFRGVMKKNITGISEDGLQVLKSYEWPGNVRELENVIERATILEESGILGTDSFPPEMTELEPVVGEYDEKLSLEDARQQVMERFEKEYLIRLLEKYNGKISDCAAHAGVSTRSIHAKMQKYTLRKEDFKHRL